MSTERHPKVWSDFHGTASTVERLSEVPYAPVPNRRTNEGES